MNFKISFILLFYQLLFYISEELTSPVINMFNPNFQTGTSQILSTTLSNTPQTFIVSYGYTMSTAALNKTLGIIGNLYSK